MGAINTGVGLLNGRLGKLSLSSNACTLLRFTKKAFEVGSSLKYSLFTSKKQRNFLSLA